MKQYLDIVRNVLDKGEWKGNRTGVRCLTTFCEVFRHDMSDGFPLLTTKKMGLKNIATELEGFIKGITTKSWYQERGCKIWNEWANPLSAKVLFDNSEPDGNVPYNEENRKQAQELCDDLGPIYGYQWRNFGKQFGPLKTTEMNPDYPNQWIRHPNGTNNGNDQLKRIVDTLKSNPNDRRMVCSAWNPNQEHMMALPPCHVLWNVVHVNGRLNLCWFQRSNDFFLGNPYNIASYGMLLLLLCKESNLVPGELVGIFSDCHLYENHMDAVKTLMSREPHSLPKVDIPDILKSGESFDIFKWTKDDFVLSDYVSHPPIKAEVAV